MNCPNCGYLNYSRVIDKRNSGPEDSIRRRRECMNCGTRFTTYELRSDMIDFPEPEEEEEFTYEEAKRYFPLHNDED